MEFGKVSGDILPKIDFALGPDDARSWIQLGRSRLQSCEGSASAPEMGANEISSHFDFHLGAPAWGAKAWLGKVYPKGTPATEFLHQYSRQFNCIELNTTHYRIPDDATIEKWISATPSDFKFCPKFPQTISHGRGLSSSFADAEYFVRQVLKLEERLGMCFLQLPPHFAPRDLPELKKFLSFVSQFKSSDSQASSKSLPKTEGANRDGINHSTSGTFQLAVEVRHPGFFENHHLIAPLFDLLHQTQTHAVILDVAGRRDVMHLSLPTSRSMLRFIGNDLHATDIERMKTWSERILSWKKLGLNEFYFFMHQPDDNVGPEAIGKMAEIINQDFEMDPPVARPWAPQVVESNAEGQADESSGQIGFKLD